MPMDSIQAMAMDSSESGRTAMPGPQVRVGEALASKTKRRTSAVAESLRKIDVCDLQPILEQCPALLIEACTQPSCQQMFDATACLSTPWAYAVQRADLAFMSVEPAA